MNSLHISISSYETMINRLERIQQKWSSGIISDEEFDRELTRSLEISKEQISNIKRRL